MKCFTHQEENYANTNCRRTGEGPNARADRLAGELFTAQMRLTEYDNRGGIWLNDQETARLIDMLKGGNGTQEELASIWNKAHAWEGSR